MTIEMKIFLVAPVVIFLFVLAAAPFFKKQWLDINEPKCMELGRQLNRKALFTRPSGYCFIAIGPNGEWKEMW